MEIRQAEFARLAKVSRATVSEKIKNKTLVVNSAGRLDTDNSVNSAYLANRRRKEEEAASFASVKTNNNCDKKRTEQPSAPRGAQTTAGTSTGGQGTTGVPEEMLGLTIRELINRYGNMANVEKYVRMLRDLTAADEKDQRIRERRLALIEKDFVVSRVFSYLDVLMNQLIDYPESVIDIIVAKVQTSPETARADAVITLRNGMTGIIGNAKDVIIREINGLKTKYQENDPLAEIQERLDEVSAQ
jgi:hypothetical protein